jgi:hypothetical protein
MTRIEREDLLRICRLRERVAKAEAVSVAAQRRAEFEAQLAAEYHFDADEVWRAAAEEAKLATQQANERISARCQELGIPRRFQPSLSEPYWFDRGENAVAKRRAELRQVANTKIDQLLKDAKLAIERASVEIQTKLVAEGLKSAEAKAFLESMPTPAELLPAVSVDEVQKQLGPGYEL